MSEISQTSENGNVNPFPSLDPFHLAIIKFNKNQIDDCIKICTEILTKNPLDQGPWVLKMKALTQKSHLDDLEIDDSTVCDILLGDSNVVMSTAARQGTSLKTNNTQKTGIGLRPITSNKPSTGYLRPATGTQPTNLEQALKTSRTLKSARPITGVSGRTMRMGTASMLSSSEGPFFNLSRIDPVKYAEKLPTLFYLFDYIYYHENDVGKALQLAENAAQIHKHQTSWWYFQIAKCLYRLGKIREAEKYFKLSLEDSPFLEVFLFLSSIHIKMDQPLSALQILSQGLSIFPDDNDLLVAQARIYEALNKDEESLVSYKRVIRNDQTNIEALSCLAAHHFYEEQPEIALKFYQRLLQMGVRTSECFNNLALSCFYSSQYHLVWPCFINALSLSSDELTTSDVWYNIGLVAMNIGDISLATQSFRLSLAENNDHPQAYNNLAVIHYHKNQFDLASAFFQSSFNSEEQIFESYYNYAILSYRKGDFMISYNSIKKSLKVNPDHEDSRQLFKVLLALFSTH